MLRLGVRAGMETEADSGHPTPRDDESSTDDGSGSPQVSTSPITSTPIANRIRNVSVRSFFERSEKQQSDDNGIADDVLAESVRQLIHSTRKNRRLTKENEKFLNESAAWYEEKSLLEKQVKENEVKVESLRNEVQEKQDRIAALEKRVADLLQCISEHPVEEVSEAAVELILDKEDVGIQCETNTRDVGIQLEENREDITLLRQEMAMLSSENKELNLKLSNFQDVLEGVSRLRKEGEQWRDKCSFLEIENTEIRKEEEKLLKEIENRNAELFEIKEEKKLLRDELDRLRAETEQSADLLKKNQELEQFQRENEKLLEEHKMQISGLRSCVASYEQTIQSLRECEREMKKQIDEKLVVAAKLDEECRTLRCVGDKLSEESVFANILNNELKLKLTQAYNDIDELRGSLSREQKARIVEVESARNMAECNKKLQESASRMNELLLLNEKMSSELDYLRQKSANSVSKQDMEQLSAALVQCQRDLENALGEKKAFLEKEEHYRQEVAKIDSLRFEIRSRDDIIAEHRAAEEKLQCDLTAKTSELLKIQSQFDELTHECCKIREEYHVFQENAEQQYCAMLEEKCQQIEAMSARLAQLETYPVIREVIEQSTLTDVVAAMKEMQGTFIPKHLLVPMTSSFANNQDAATSTSYLEEGQGEAQKLDMSSKLCDSLPLAQVAACLDGLEDYRLHGDSPDLRPELRRFFARIKYEHEIKTVEAAARHFLESCDRLFLDNAKELFRKEIQNIHDCKDALEKLISSERLQWTLERGNMELQLDRYRRQVEQFPNIHKENASIKSELNATRTQIEQYRLKLRQKCEEVERLEVEKDGLTALAKEFQKLDKESQEEVQEANKVIDELEGKLKDVSADLERERREVILLKDDIDAFALHIHNLKTTNIDLVQKVQLLMANCDKLEKTEKYNQKTIQIVCECFWEREDFVKRLKKRSSERKRLIERFVEEVGVIIAKFGGNSDSVNEMHATIMSWASADVKDDNDNESRKRDLWAQLAELGSEQQCRLAQQQVMIRSKQKPQ